MATRKTLSKRGSLSLAVVFLILALVGIFSVLKLGDSTEDQTTADILADNNSQAAQNLLTLTVAAEETREQAPDYDRDYFGDSWADIDHNGCDTRNDILARDLTDIEIDADGCKILSGTLQDPYSGETINFERGQSTSSKVQIDHVVPLADAWKAGAWQWDDWQRLEFANDTLNLVAVSGSLNSQKGAQTADEWLPPNEDFQCTYAIAQINVKTKWDLSVTESEQQALAKVLSTCPET